MKRNKKKPEDRELGYKILTPFMRVAFRLWYNPKIIGAEKIPADGPIVIACNHKHLFDQCLTIMATKRVIHYLAKREYFDGKLAPFFRLVGCIPVDRARRDFSSAKSALAVLNKGGAIGIFPEGTRNKTDKFMLPLKTGAVSIAKKAGAYVVPCGLTGDYRFRSKNLTVRYGEPFSVSDMTVEEANEKLRGEIERLMLENLENKSKKNIA